ncbi:MAG: PSD1 and planctomycete cytochrome C domain-containing protein [Bryobacteraceae bacterium]
MRRAILSLVFAAALPAADSDTFEREIRPLLAEHCSACHGALVKSPFAGLRVDSPAALRRGTPAGPVIVPGKPGESRLLLALRGKLAQPMPPSGRLPEAKIAAIEAWIAAGAPMPEVPEAAPAISSFNLDERRAAHWAWQPVLRVQPPAVRDSAWPVNEPDRFLLARMETAKVRPAAEADRLTLLRRATYDLHGLPPSPEQIREVLTDTAPGAWERLVDRLLESPQFGERMARRWMDLVRYSESHGSEGDPDTPDAWRYRDYLIRAFNNDVPYDQLIREHLAGDLLPTPRIDPASHVNESILGAANLRMVEHGFQPVDPWEDRVKWTDNQIDVFAKAFQGLTISCARCHDHKFDAISQSDYYALFGIFAGARPTQVAIDDPALLAKNRDELAALKSEIRRAIAEDWLKAAVPAKAFDELQAMLPTAQEADAARDFNKANFTEAWDLRRDFPQWLGQGTGFPKKAAAPGEFWIQPQGDRALDGIYPGGVYTNLLSNKHGAVIASPRFRIETDSISLRLLGGNFSFAQLIIENYAVPRGGIYHLRYSPKKDAMGWVRWDTTFWKGFSAYIEFATLDEVTHFLPDAESQKMKPRPQPKRDGRSWIGAQRIFFHNNTLIPKEDASPARWMARTARAAADLLPEAIRAWRDGSVSEEQASFLDWFVREGRLPVTLADLPTAGTLIARYRRLEAEVPLARRAPGVFSEAPPPQRLLVRGSHKNFGDPVPQRYLTALNSNPYPDTRLARLRLAEEVASADNPLTARVMVNRVWHSLFRRGIVASVDNFGKLGDAPSHPELLDWLARRFVEDGWSLKKLVRLLASSRAYRMSAAASEEALRSDPANLLVSHQTMRRLEAEEVRDGILAASGQLDSAMFGPSVDVYYAHDTGKTKGDKPKGPLDGNGRRSVYLEIRRNATNPFLEVFDFPVPASTRGQRDVTNTPAQPLALLNSPFVIAQSEKWAARLAALPDDTARVEAIFLRALGRPPQPGERDSALTYARQSESPWRDLAHSVFNLKEFLYVR